MTSHTTLEISDHVARLRMDDGKANALSTELLGEIGAGLHAARAADAVVVLEGRKGIFSGGFDLSTFSRGIEAGIEMVQAGAELVLRLLEFPNPVLTVCTGHAYPAGAFLMLASDVRFGVAGPWRIGFNEVAIGMTVPKFAIALAHNRLTAPGFVRVLTASMVDPDEARRLGFLDRVLEPGALEAAVAEEIARLRALDMRSFQATKQRMNAPVATAVRKAIAEELAEIKASTAAAQATDRESGRGC